VQPQELEYLCHADAMVSTKLEPAVNCQTEITASSSDCRKGCAEGNRIEKWTYTAYLLFLTPLLDTHATHKSTQSALEQALSNQQINQ